MGFSESLNTKCNTITLTLTLPRENDGNFVEIGFSDGIKEISSKWGSWKFPRNGVHGNLVEMGFFKCLNRGSCGNFFNIGFTEDLY
jgi:hypothetical protein